MKYAGHRHSTGAKIVLTNQRCATGQVEMLAPGDPHAEVMRVETVSASMVTKV
jgi:hypothetical protein